MRKKQSLVTILILLVFQAVFSFAHAETFRDEKFQLLEAEILALIDGGELEKAKETLRKIETYAASDWVQGRFHYYAGRIAMETDDSERAIHSYGEAARFSALAHDKQVEGQAILRMTRLQQQVLSDSVVISRYEQSAELLMQTTDTTGLISAWYELGTFMIERGNIETGKPHLEAAKELAELAEDQRSAVTIDNFWGYHYFYQGEFEKALEYCLASLRKYKALEEVKDVARTENMLGGILNRLDEPKKGLEYLQSALATAREHDFLSIEASTLTNMGVISQEMGDYDAALESLLLAFEVYRKMDKQSGQSACLNNIAYNYEQKKQFKDAIHYQKRALEIDQRIGDKVGEMISYVNLGEYHRQLENHQEALKYYKKCEAMLKHSPSIQVDACLYNGYGKSYEALGNFEQALHYQSLHDSIQLALTKANADTSVGKVWEYEANQKGELIESLEEQNGRQRNRILLSISIGGGIILIVIAVLVFVYSKKRKQEKVLQELEEELEKRETELQGLNRNVEDLSEKLGLQENLIATASSTFNGEASSASFATFIEKVRNNRLWSTFLPEFELAFPDFLRKLKTEHDDLGTTDLRMLALVKMGLNTNEIAEFLSITPAGVKKARQRIRKKLKLETAQQLGNYLSTFDI